MAVGILILHFVPGFKPELISFLFGNILAIQNFDLLLMVLFAVLILLFVIFQFRSISLLIFDRESAYLSRIPVFFYELLLYIAWALAVVLGVKMLGIILVSALLIIPASVARLAARSFSALVWGSVIVGEFIVILGLVLSVLLNVPSGAMIILVGFVLLVVVAFINKFALAKK
jgi:zinc transport system permease protein